MKSKYKNIPDIDDNIDSLSKVYGVFLDNLEVEVHAQAHKTGWVDSIIKFKDYLPSNLKTGNSNKINQDNESKKEHLLSLGNIINGYIKLIISEISSDEDKVKVFKVLKKLDKVTKIINADGVGNTKELYEKIKYQQDKNGVEGFNNISSNYYENKINEKGGFSVVNTIKAKLAPVFVQKDNLAEKDSELLYEFIDNDNENLSSKSEEAMLNLLSENNNSFEKRGEHLEKLVNGTIEELRPVKMKQKIKKIDGKIAEINKDIAKADQGGARTNELASKKNKLVSKKNKLKEKYMPANDMGTSLIEKLQEYITKGLDKLDKVYIFDLPNKDSYNSDSDDSGYNTNPDDSVNVKVVENRNGDCEYHSPKYIEKKVNKKYRIIAELFEKYEATLYDGYGSEKNSNNGDKNSNNPGSSNPKSNKPS